MADYYPVIARAVSVLPNNDAQARRRVYERAQTVLIGALRKQNPRISAMELMGEHAALETAIQRVEAELRSDSIPTSKHPPPRTLPATRPAVADDGLDVRLRLQPSTQNQLIARADPARPQRTSKRSQQPTKPASNRDSSIDDLGGMLHSLGAICIGVALIATMLAFLGYVYFYGLILASEYGISYLVPLVAASITLCLFVLLGKAMFRRVGFAVGFLLSR